MTKKNSDQSQSEIKIAVLEAKLDYMSKGIDGLGQSLENLNLKISNGFVSKVEFNSFKQQVDDDVKELKESRTYATRTVFGAIVTSVFSLISTVVVFLFKK